MATKTLKPPTQPSISELLEKLQQLELRVQELEAARPPFPAAVAAAASIPAAAPLAAPAPVATEEIPEEIVLAISAAIASFLGVKAHVKQIRLVSTTEAWAQHGRVSIMASHRWAMQR